MTITVLHFDDHHTYYNIFILFSISNQFYLETHCEVQLKVHRGSIYYTGYINC